MSGVLLLAVSLVAAVGVAVAQMVTRPPLPRRSFLALAAAVVLGIATLPVLSQSQRHVDDTVRDVVLSADGSGRVGVDALALPRHLPIGWRVAAIASDGQGLAGNDVGGTSQDNTRVEFVHDDGTWAYLCLTAKAHGCPAASSRSAGERSRVTRQLTAAWTYRDSRAPVAALVDQPLVWPWTKAGAWIDDEQRLFP